MDHCIQEAFLSGSDESFSQMMYLIMSENVSPDYQVNTHSQVSVLHKQNRYYTVTAHLFQKIVFYLRLLSTSSYLFYQSNLSFYPTLIQLTEQHHVYTTLVTSSLLSCFRNTP